jgi:hypothetical protein
MKMRDLEAVIEDEDEDLEVVIEAIKVDLEVVIEAIKVDLVETEEIELHIKEIDRGEKPSTEIFQR